MLLLSKTNFDLQEWTLKGIEKADSGSTERANPVQSTCYPDFAVHLLLNKRKQAASKAAF